MADPITPNADPAPASAPNPIEAAAEALARQITAAGDRVVENMRSAAPPSPQPDPNAQANAFAKSIDDLATEKGTGAAVLQAVGQAGSALLAEQARRNAAIRKDMAKADPTLIDSKGVSLIARYDAAIEKHIRDNGITPEYLEKNGYAAVAQQVAYADPAYRAELQAKAVEDYKAQQAALAAKPITAQAEGVNVGAVVATPAQPTTEAQEIAAIKFDKDHEAILTKRFPMMKKEDFQRQAWEIEKTKERLGGVEGIRQVGGIPVCLMNELPTSRFANSPKVQMIDAEAFSQTRERVPEIA